MLLNRDNNLVLPPRIETTAKGATITQEAVSGPVALDLRVGPNIRLGNDPSALPPNMRAQAEPHIAGLSPMRISSPVFFRKAALLPAGAQSIAAIPFRTTAA